MPWYILAIISALALGIYSIVEKKGLKKTDSVSFLFVNWLIIAVGTIPLIFFIDISNITILNLTLLAIKTVSAAIFFILIAKALKHMEISEFSPFLSFSPLIVLLISSLALGERVSMVNITGMILVVIGAYVLELKDGFLSPIKNIKNNKYIHYIFIGLLFAGVCAVLDRAILKSDINFLVFYFYNNLFLFAIMAIFTFLKKDGVKNIKMSFKKVLPIAFIGALLYVAGDISYFLALSIPAALVALVIPVKRLSILISTILGGELFHEKNLLKKTIATLIMLGGVFLIVI